MKTVGLLAVLVTLALPASPPPLKMTDRCVTKADRSRVVRFKASDGTRLIGLQLGSGPRGVVLAHGYRSSLCEWLPQARRLARAGYRVVVFDHRNHGSSSYARKRFWRVDLDVVGAVRTIRGRGATSVVLAGSSMGAMAVLVGGTAVQQSIDGVVSLSSPSHISTVNAEAAVTRLLAPTLLVAAEDDDPFDDDARTLFAALAGRDKRLEVVAGTAHGSGLLGDPSIRALFDEFLRTHST
jgi:alpha-beta hydrolase superfamily lysophospholipase